VLRQLHQHQGLTTAASHRRAERVRRRRHRRPV